MFKKLLIPSLAILVIIIGTLVAIKFAQGYRPNLTKRYLQGTGLLVANSFPSGAQVFINAKLTTATDDTLNLPPGEYHIAIKRDGFSPWSKTLKLEAELVAQTNATLFPSVPTLKPLTFTGALSPLSSPDGQKILYLVKTASLPNKNGLWVIDLNPTATAFIRPREPRQISRNLDGLDFTNATLTWSPDSNQVLVHFDKNNYLLDANRLTDPADLKDATARLPLLLSDWEEQLTRKQHQQLLSLPPALKDLLTPNATNFYFSPDEKKLLYTATAAITLPDNLLPSLPASSHQPQQRHLTPGAIYVYDLKEDRNFAVADPPPAELGQPAGGQAEKILLGADASPSAYTKLQKGKTLIQTLQLFTAQYTPLTTQSLQWFPTSNHLVFTQPDKITLLEYDGLNRTTIYSGAFDPSFVYPSPTGSQLIIITNLNQDSQLPSNLYLIDLK